MAKVRLEISYDGTGFGGWQRLGPGSQTIQEELEKGLSQILNQPIKVIGSGRTDAGVHALAQNAHFRVQELPRMKDFVYALNCQLPASIRVQRAWEAPEDFHAIRSAIRKTYKFRVLNRPRPSALKVRYTHWVREPLDLDHLNELSKVLVGKRDFKSFQSGGTEVKTTVRTIEEALWRRRPGHILEFTITGSGFLKQMVRNIVGTLIDLDLKKSPKADLEAILAGCDRRLAGPTAPPQGLYLFTVDYGPELDSKCRKL